MVTYSYKELLLFLMMMIMYVAPSYEAENPFSWMRMGNTEFQLGPINTNADGFTQAYLTKDMRINFASAPKKEVSGGIDFSRNERGVERSGDVTSDESQNDVQKERKMKDRAKKKRRSSKKDVKRSRKRRSSKRSWKINSNNGKVNRGNSLQGSNIKIGDGAVKTGRREDKYSPSSLTAKKMKQQTAAIEKENNSGSADEDGTDEELPEQPAALRGIGILRKNGSIDVYGSVRNGKMITPKQ